MAINLPKSGLDFDRLKEIVRYYQAGAINALFGFGVYSALVYFGVNLFVAQIISQILGMLFNYMTYSRHVFVNNSASKTRFVLSYVVNYMLSLAILAIASIFIKSPYVSGALAIVVVSIINYFFLKYLVFTKAA
jgi:putative flippase GtrA